MASVTPTSIFKFPGYFATQVHPENESMPILAKLEAQFDMMRDCFVTVGAEFGSIPSNFEKPRFISFSHRNFKAKEEKKSKGPKTSDEVLDPHQKFSEFYTQQMQTNFGFLPKYEAPQYWQAMEVIEKQAIKRDLTDYKPEELMTLFAQINGFVCGSGGIPSKIRPPIGLVVYNYEVISDTRNAETFKIVDRFVLEHFPDKKALWANSTRKKIWDFTFKQKVLWPEFISEERELIKDFIFIPTAYVQKEYLKFCSELPKKVKEEKDIFKLMAWIHDRFTEIHPYLEGNGRTARLIMAMAGMQRGVRPLLFDNGKNYTAAVKKGSDAFAEYLRGLAEKQVGVRPFIEECLRELFENTLEKAQ